MYALILTSLQPPSKLIAKHGTYKRIRLFANALHSMCDTLDTVYSVTDEDVPKDADLLQAEQNHQPTETEYWGFPVRPHFIRRRVRDQSFRHEYLDGIVSSAEQPQLYRWAGRAQAEAIGRLLDTDPDIVVVNNLHTMLAILRSGRRPRSMFFDLDDVQHRVRLRWFRQPPVTPGKLLHLAQVPALIASEFKAARMAKATFVCSELDRSHLRSLGFPRVSVIPNAVPSRVDLPKLATDPVLLFVGSVGHTPNAEAATRMVTRIFPIIEAAVPNATLLIAGPGTDTLPCRATASSRITFLGFVDDLAGVYARSRIFVCPMQTGGGTRIKIIDAAAYGIPVVSTRMGAEGLDFVDGESIVLADTDKDFARSCIDLLKSDTRTLAVRRSAETVMRTHYEAAAIEARLKDIFAEAM
jgi:glycosyltransferase involved in cell wall biosynthesis